MTQLIEFPVDSDPGHVVIVEVDEASGAGVERAGRRGEVVGQAAKSMTEAVEHVLPAAEVVLDKLRGLVSAPDEVTVTFGVKLALSSGPSSPRRRAKGTSRYS